MYKLAEVISQQVHPEEFSASSTPMPAPRVHKGRSNSEPVKCEREVILTRRVAKTDYMGWISTFGGTKLSSVVAPCGSRDHHGVVHRCQPCEAAVLFTTLALIEHQAYHALNGSSHSACVE